jgi:hypothetical protein
MNTVYAMAPEEFEAERKRLQDVVDHLPRPESYSVRDELIDAGVVLELEDTEIIDMVAEAFDLTKPEAIDRLARIDFAKARELAAV